MSEQPTKRSKIDLAKVSNLQLKNYIDSFEQKNDGLEKHLDSERSNIQARQSPLLEVLASKSPRSMVELQSTNLSFRCEIQELITSYQNKLTKGYSLLRHSEGDRQQYYSEGYGIKVSDRTRKDLIDRDLRETIRRKELLEAHIDYLRETRYTCDQIQFAVKNYVGIIDYLDKD